MGKQEITFTNLSIHKLLIDSILEVLSLYEIGAFQQQISKLVPRIQANYEKIGSLEKEEEITLNLRSELLEDTIRLLELFNTLEPIRNSKGDLQLSEKTYAGGKSEDYAQHFSNLKLDSKASLGFEILFYSPPEEAALHWYHNVLLPVISSWKSAKSIDVDRSFQSFMVNKKIKVKDYLKTKNLDSNRFKITHIEQGLIKPGWRSFLEPNMLYFLIDEVGLLHTCDRLNQDLFGWYAKHYGKIQLGYHTRPVSGDPSGPTVPAMPVYTGTPISVRDWLSNQNLHPTRFTITHVSMGISENTIMVPGRAYMLTDKAQMQMIARMFGNFG